MGHNSLNPYDIKQAKESCTAHYNTRVFKFTVILVIHTHNLKQGCSSHVGICRQIDLKILEVQ